MRNLTITKLFGFAEHSASLLVKARSSEMGSKIVPVLRPNLLAYPVLELQKSIQVPFCVSSKSCDSKQPSLKEVPEDQCKKDTVSKVGEQSKWESQDMFHYIDASVERDELFEIKEVHSTLVFWKSILV